ncbi:DsbA family oxidoreductase [Humibacter ginsenosidimutans]|uniref:DsbA family oxidoreductase n=1 Tax=Humibacter ginsenosidimutans TaxID=2599293 RepID=A0A5B8M103_9MICO|nr:DsbA family oxidoreductase [Humibacter ginsenosidimutans]QDZ13946.1 DsbA family oxidoreductase [Humibacter ginsenosidimutans]
MSEPIKVDIWSDIACPWCYIGKRKFEAGAGLFSGGGDDRDVEVEFHSFELSPDTPVDFHGNEADYLAQHKGISPEQAEQMLERVGGIAKQVGLDYDFGSMQHTNTVKAHELIHYAKAHGKQAEMKERLMRAYFIDGGHVGRIDDLIGYASEVGLDAEDARAALERNDYLAAVREDQATAQEFGINGVPFYVIDGKYGVSGAQEAATFAQVLEQVWTERGSDAAASDDEADVAGVYA